MDFSVSANHRLKIRESDKLDNYTDLARELKKFCYMKLTVILIRVGVLGTV